MTLRRRALRLAPSHFVRRAQTGPRNTLEPSETLWTFATCVSYAIRPLETPRVEIAIGIRSVHMGMAVVTERSAAEKLGVGLATKESGRPLEMTLNAQGIVVGDQELVIRRAMGRMAIATTFLGSEMLEDIGPLELRMTFVAARVLAVQGHIGRRLAMNRMAIGAIHLAFRHTMVVLKFELRVDSRVALDAEIVVALCIQLRRLRIDTGRRRVQVVDMTIPTPDIRLRMIG